MKNQETTLSGGQRTEYMVKIGARVHRTKSSNFGFIHTTRQLTKRWRRFSEASRAKKT